MKRKVLFYVFLTTSIFAFGQQDRVEEKYPSYFELPREALFLHTNKTTFIVGEEAWFKAYAYDRKHDFASNATTNIYLGIYDENGKPIQSKILLAKQGITQGNIDIDSTFASGNYYIKVSTNWMRNFKEDDSFVQQIQIINPEDDKRTTPQLFNKEYDFQLLPEGGHILADVKNTIGVKILNDQGKNTKCSGTIVDSKGQEITRFTTNFLGLGKFSFTPKSNESYTVKVVLPNGRKFDHSIEEIKDTGIALNVNSLSKNDVIVNLVTNETSWKFINKKSYKLLIHKDGVAKIIPIQFQNTKEQIAIAKDGLFKGINTVTLFDANEKPIVERMFFNDYNLSFRTFTLDQKMVAGDSITYRLNTPLQDSLKINASISVLPTNTKSYDPEHNILSAFYLKPYLKGTIEKPHYYFRNRNRKKVYELDMLLLTQGWSRYEWQDVFQSTPYANFEFEDGFTVNGNLNVDLSKVKSLLLYPTKRNKSRFINYDETGKFSIPNFYPTPNEKLNFSYISKSGKAKVPSMVAKPLIPNIHKNPIDVDTYTKYKTFYADKNDIPTNFFNDQRELLNEIVLSSRLDVVYKKRRGPPFSGKVIKVTDSVAKTYVTLDRVFNTEGRVQIGYTEGAMAQGGIISGIQTDLTISFGRPTFFYLDGNYLQPFQIHNLLTTNTAAFEDIYIDYSTNLVYDPITNVPVTNAIIVNIFSRISSFEDKGLMRLSHNFIETPTGFEVAKKFYTPRYIDYKIKSFQDYGVIHWEPNVNISQEKPTEITMVHTGLEEIDFYIEGIASDGSIFSQIIRMEHPKK